MLLTSINQVTPGSRVGAVVMNPVAPDVTLLKPGAELTGPIIGRLRSMGLRQVWIEHELTRDLDHAVNPNLLRVRLAVYSHLKRDLQRLAQRSITNAQVQIYRRAVIDLVTELVAHRPYAGLADQLYDADCDLISHSSNVAYLAMLVGLELAQYLVQERPRLPQQRARNVVNLGLAAMLHDIGKVRTRGPAAACHEILAPDPVPAEYPGHPRRGYEMMRHADVPPTVRHVVLSHHRRFNGKGWPDLARLTADGRRVQPSGHRVHIFTRIVSAANALDNLMTGAGGARRPPVAALHDFAGDRFDGWFDPVVRQAVLRRLPPFAIGSRVVLSDGQAAVVVAPNAVQPCRPVVRLLDGQATIELNGHPDLSIRECAGVDVANWLFELEAPGRDARERPEAA